jgi:hypothetical protein
MHVVAIASAEQLAHRQPRDLAEDVPAGDVDAALDVGMPLERGVHASIQLAEFARIGAEQVRRELAQAGAHAVRVCGQVKRSERAHLAVSGQTVVRFDAHDGAVEDSDGLAARPLVRRFM